MTVRRMAAILLAALPAAPLGAADLAVAKSFAVVADPLALARPRLLPGATVDYALTVTNPLANVALPVDRVVIADTIADHAKLRVADYATAGRGPVEFTDGNLLGLLGSGLGYSYGGLSAARDGLEFSDGTSWNYVPVPDAEGYDARVRGIRVTFTGSYATGSSFRLRYRVAIR